MYMKYRVLPCSFFLSFILLSNPAKLSPFLQFCYNTGYSDESPQEKVSCHNGNLRRRENISGRNFWLKVQGFSFGQYCKAW